jgi:type II secretion system protein G
MTMPQMHGPNSGVRFAIEELSASVDMFALETGRLPKDTEGLSVLLSKPQNDPGNWNGPYLRRGRIPLDAWDTPFVYRRVNKAAQGYVIYSAGPNRIDDLGKDDDIVSWAEQEPCYFVCRDRTFLDYVSVISLALSGASSIALLYLAVALGFRFLFRLMRRRSRD